jgi:hypothetical protein
MVESPSKRLAARPAPKGESGRLPYQGYTISLDQASNAAGVSLWLLDELQAWTVLKSEKSRDPFCKRVQDQANQLDAWLASVLPPSATIYNALFEGVRSRIVLCTVGAFCLSKRIQSHVHAKSNFVETGTWKSWAKAHGALGPNGDIKGVKALREVGFDMDKYGIDSDDAADSVLMYLAWRAK